MKLYTIIVFAIAAAFMTSCRPEPKGMERKIDGSSDEAAEQSIEKLATELSPDQLKKFTEAYGQLALAWAFSSVFSGEDNKGSSEFLAQINGKSPQEIIDLAAAQELDDAAPAKIEEKKKEEKKEAKTVHLNLPFNIDGIKILIIDLRIGKLEKVERQFSFGSIPDGEFLLATVALKNTTEGTIIQIQDAWGNATVKDNFDNIYNKPSTLIYSMGEVKGVVSSQALKPGETVTDLIIIEKPLDNASDFTLIADPKFYRNTGNNMLKQLSSDSFRLNFKRTDIK